MKASYRTHLSALMSLFVLALATDASAQESIELTPTQLKNNEEGVRLLSEGKFDAAREHFELSLRIGESNITYLNLGRTYQKMGDCLRAKENFAKAASAPTIASPTAAEVNAVRESFLSELPEVCPARVTVTCSPNDPVVSLDQSTDVECGSTIDVSPGKHTLTGIIGEYTTTENFDVAEGEALEVAVIVEPEIIATPSGPPESSGSLDTYGWVSMGVGAAFLTTAIVFDAVLMQAEVDAAKKAIDDRSLEDHQAARENFEDLQTPTLVFYGVGAAALVTGAVLILWPESDTSIALTPTLNGAAVGLSGSF